MLSTFPKIIFWPLNFRSKLNLFLDQILKVLIYEKGSKKDTKLTNTGRNNHFRKIHWRVSGNSILRDIHVSHFPLRWKLCIWLGVRSDPLRLEWHQFFVYGPMRPPDPNRFFIIFLGMHKKSGKFIRFHGRNPISVIMGAIFRQGGQI